MRVSYACAFALAFAACASPGSRQCLINTDCKLGSWCDRGVCRTDCRADRDCAAGACDLALGRCLGLPDGGVVDFAGMPDFAGPPADFAGGPVDMAMLKKYGDVCQMPPECASGYCSVNPFAPGDHECTGDCNAGCMFGDFCVANTTCAQSDVGRPCNLQNGGNDCRAGACLGGGGAPFCTRFCSSAADCPGGFTCSSLQNGQRGCIDVDATGPCANNGQCAYGTFCDVARARCLGDCRNDGDCPLWNVCKSGLCAPKIATGGGGIDAPCGTANDCRTGACLANRCLGGCSVVKAKGQWCPGGWGCNPVDDGQGGFTLGCLAAGAGSPGAPCNDNTDCASGVCIDNPGYCTRWCNGAPCPQNVPNCVALGVMADGINLMACSK